MKAFQAEDMEMNQILKLVLGVVLGTSIGLILPEFYVKTLVTIHEIIGQLISFTIPLLILFFVGEGIAALPNNSGKLLSQTVLYAYISTILAGTMAYFAVQTVLPSFMTSDSSFIPDEIDKVTSFFTFSVTPIFDVMTALVLAFIFGIGVSSLKQQTLKKVFVEGREIIDLILAKVIIPLLPVYIAGVFAAVAYEGTVMVLFKTFSFVFLLILSLHWLYLIGAYMFVGSVIKKSPFKLLSEMLPAYFTALGTMSSAATIPITLEKTKRIQVRPEVAHFTIPLCASIHLSGSVITLVTCSIAVIAIFPDLHMVSPMHMFGFIMMLGIAMIAAPGAPGGGVMSAIGLLSSILGFNEEAIALMIALYLAQDSFGTACNVLGDGALSLLVNKFAKQTKEQDDLVSEPEEATK
tara:strand:- start:852 stop:2075 length:1224 start_codon:yes stop_codon:yes gene_type:complete